MIFFWHYMKFLLLESYSSRKVKSIFYTLILFLNTGCVKQVCNSYILSTFCYGPLIWIFYSSNMIEEIYKRVLRAVCRLFDASFSELLKVDQSFSIYVGSLLYLITEIFKPWIQVRIPIFWGCNHSYGISTIFSYTSKKFHYLNYEI